MIKVSSSSLVSSEKEYRCIYIIFNNVTKNNVVNSRGVLDYVLTIATCTMKSRIEKSDSYLTTLESPVSDLRMTEQKL